MINVVVEVSGGVVCAVYHTTIKETLNVTLLDWDNIEAGDDMPELPKGMEVKGDEMHWDSDIFSRCIV